MFKPYGFQTFSVNTYLIEYGRLHEAVSQHFTIPEVQATFW